MKTTSLITEYLIQHRKHHNTLSQQPPANPIQNARTIVQLARLRKMALLFEKNAKFVRKMFKVNWQDFVSLWSVD